MKGWDSGLELTLNPGVRVNGYPLTRELGLRVKVTIRAYDKAVRLPVLNAQFDTRVALSPAWSTERVHRVNP